MTQFEYLRVLKRSEPASLGSYVHYINCFPPGKVDTNNLVSSFKEKYQIEYSQKSNEFRLKNSGTFTEDINTDILDYFGNYGWELVLGTFHGLSALSVEMTFKRIRAFS